MFPEPSEDNGYLTEHVARLRKSLLLHTGRDLVGSEADGADAAKEVFDAPFAVMSHDMANDPVFNYANRAALALFEMDWSEFTSLPSRLSVEPANRRERERLLREVAQKGYIDDYSGVRISRSGKRFLIERAVVWNLVDERGEPCGQAAMFEDWKYL